MIIKIEIDIPEGEHGLTPSECKTIAKLLQYGHTNGHLTNFVKTQVKKNIVTFAADHDWHLHRLDGITVKLTETNPSVRFADPGADAIQQT